ncbi:hypothetical protein AVEN_216377-1 [Araneus ventricosus]|uniref:Uncharacterized protein n=1 Tax=Araneus ventricosus TaxID=182803 RepID=A0A4Y2V8B6_ARAVE|nr:hypothetical protein AVEN_216377-1 [Araneus ventricosus]
MVSGIAKVNGSRRIIKIPVVNSGLTSVNRARSLVSYGIDSIAPIKPGSRVVNCPTAMRKTLKRVASSRRVEERRETDIKSAATFGELSALR